MKKNAKLMILLCTLLLGLTLCLAGCGGSDDEDGSTQNTTKAESSADDFSYETDPYSEMSDAELEKLKQEAKIKNQDEKFFYGTWVGDEEEAYNLYGSIKLTINKDGTFDADLSDGEEVFSGTWKKIDGGIAYNSELMSGKLFYGEYCQMTIDNGEWDYDDEETGMAVTLTKQK